MNRAADECLNELLADCRRLGVRVVLLRMPEGPLYRSSYDPEAAAALESYGPAWRSIHGAAIFVNANCWFDDEAMFVDSHHLHAHGRQVFTRRLAQSLAAQVLGGSSDGNRSGAVAK